MESLYVLGVFIMLITLGVCAAISGWRAADRDFGHKYHYFIDNMFVEDSAPFRPLTNEDRAALFSKDLYADIRDKVK